MIRLLLRFVAGTVITLLAAAAVVYWLLRYPPSQPDELTLRKKMFSTATAVAKQLAVSPEPGWDRIFSDYNTHEHLWVFDFELGESDFPKEMLEALQSGKPLFLSEDDGGPSVLKLVDGTDTVLDVQPRQPFDDPYPVEILIAAAGALIVIGGFGLLMFAPVVRRLRALENAARAYGKGDWSTRAADLSLDAIGDLGRALDRMAAEIQQLLKDQQDLLQAVAHELRAPLSRLEFALEIANDADTEDDRVAAFNDMHAGADALNQLVAEVLGYARLQPGAERLERDHADLQPIVEELVTQQRQGNPDMVFEVVAPTEACIANIDAGYFHRALLNLLSNAARYAQRRVRVSWDGDGRKFWLTVEDDGIGIPPYQRERVFEPFTRLDPSRARHSGGIGLGLAIVQRISHKHGGRVTVGESPLGGVQFCLEWPCNSVELTAGR